MKDSLPEESGISELIHKVNKLLTEKEKKDTSPVNLIDERTLSMKEKEVFAFESRPTNFANPNPIKKTKEKK